MYGYRAFGCNIDSELELPELAHSTSAADLIIRFGRVPESLSNPTSRGVRFQATATQLLLRVDGHAGFLAERGREILVEPTRSNSGDAIRLFLLGPVMGAILHQRSVLALHASVVEIDGGATLLAGPSGAGKSTLAAVLSKRGHRVLSDEIAAVSLREGRPYVFPGARRINVWADVASALGEKLDALRRVRPELEKYAFPLFESYGDSQLPISNVFILSSRNVENLTVDRIKGVEKLTAIVGNTYRPQFAGDPDWTARHFEQCSAIAANARIMKIERPEHELPLSDMAALVESNAAL